MARRRNRKDLNHEEIKQFLIDNGISVFDSGDVGGGFTDLVIGDCDINLLIEIKSGHKFKLTRDQMRFHEEWAGQKAIVFDKRTTLLEIIGYCDSVCVNAERLKQKVWKILYDLDEESDDE